MDACTQYHTPVNTADSHSQATGAELLDSVAAAEREIAASPEYAPLAEWEVRRVVPVNDTLLPYQVCASHCMVHPVYFLVLCSSRCSVLVPSKQGCSIARREHAGVASSNTHRAWICVCALAHAAIIDK